MRLPNRCDLPNIAQVALLGNKNHVHIRDQRISRCISTLAEVRELLVSAMALASGNASVFTLTGTRETIVRIRHYGKIANALVL